MTMRPYLKDACESIDAGIFSGDAFYDKKARNELHKYLARWRRGLHEIALGPHKATSPLRNTETMDAKDCPRGFVPYCATYHCAGDCGLPHNQDERVQQFTAAGRAQERSPSARRNWRIFAAWSSSARPSRVCWTAAPTWTASSTATCCAWPHRAR